MAKRIPKNPAETRQRVTREHSPEMKDKLVEFIERKKLDNVKISKACELAAQELPHFKGMSAGSIESLYWYWRSFKKRQANKAAQFQQTIRQPISTNPTPDQLQTMLEPLRQAMSDEPPKQEPPSRKSTSKDEALNRWFDLMERGLELIKSRD